jgi:SAM-dependent methyltransferase
MGTLTNGTSVDPLLQFGVLLQCPRCAARLSGMECPVCSFEIDIDNGIMHALPEERSQHFARFAQDYQYIRAAEGRSGNSDSFYLDLPYHDVTGRNSKQWLIRARSYDHLLDRVLYRGVARGGLILDVGAGNCWMSYRLALAGYRPVAVDLVTNRFDGLGAARHYQARLPNLFPRFQADMQHLPFQDAQFDAAIFNASFHYSEDYATTLRSVLRCVRKGGLVVISDTPWYSREESGRQMLRERRAAFLKTYGTSSDALQSQEFLTDKRLRDLEEEFSIRWTAYTPHYGFHWAMRPLKAKLLRRREPSRFRIYVARKNA